MCVMTSSVSFFLTSNAAMLSISCEDFDAPVITVDTFLFFKHHARAN